MPYFYKCIECEKVFEPPFDSHKSQVWVDACHVHNEEGLAVCLDCLGIPFSEYLTLQGEAENENIN